MKKAGQPSLPVGVRRSTNTWSPMSRVFSMELEGISNCWMTKPRMKSPPTKTAASPAMVSGRVSFSLCVFSSFFFVSVSTLVGKVLFLKTSSGFGLCIHDQASAHQVKHTAPAGMIKEMDYHMQHKAGAFHPGGMLPLIGRRYKRPIDKHGPSYNVLAGDKPPVATIQAVFSIIAHPEVVALRHY